MKKFRKTRSMRGEEVDFDLMDVKAQIASQPKTTEVAARQDFIESRLNRRLKRKLDREKKLKEDQANEEITKKEKVIETSVATTKEPVAPVEVEKPAPKARKIKKKKIED